MCSFQVIHKQTTTGSQNLNETMAYYSPKCHQYDPSTPVFVPGCYLKVTIILISIWKGYWGVEIFIKVITFFFSVCFIKIIFVFSVAVLSHYSTVVSWYLPVIGWF